MSTASVGEHIREWRKRRHLSQLDLACDAEISTRHLSFLETGRARPSREMVLRLAECLDVPIRERNVLLIAAGFAPAFSERSTDDPNLSPAMQAVELVLRGHEPYPALAIDRHWNLVLANSAAQRVMAGVAPELLEPPVNVLKVALHPQGLAPRTANLAEWRAHLLARLRQQIDFTADQQLTALYEELRSYPAPPGARGHERLTAPAIALPYQLVAGETVLSFLSTTTVFGTPLDVTVSEIAIESFFPADAATSEALRAIAGRSQG